VVQRERARLGELDGERLDAAAGGAREEAGGALGDREVREAADREVEHVLVGPAGAVERADHREGREVDALGAQAGGADRGDEVGDHVAPGGDEQEPLQAGLGALDDLERLVVDDRLVDRHRQLVGRVEADGRRELLGVAQVGQLQRADDDLLVGDADADPLAEALVVAEEGAQGVAERRAVDHLAVADDAGLEGRERGRLHIDAAVDGDLRDGDAAGVDVHADEVLDALGHVLSGEIPGPLVPLPPRSAGRAKPVPPSGA
jgi:hypothetical protein